ncbi:putative protein-disulfide isomerase [Quadrisphaera granulorum]|uniref:DSBA-like thioredoxin domain-containing protein n=1 Tax=Quadrisphaera granulorum TaxID=317664 RepID=A0A316ACC9_9ACTN|nr:DsbA family protein [Quadrisphaera granulorum]PWJ54928.1 putative protein-disulfide isomerase [Quadrisphaera granulorum]SZE95874.1 putative protein-disulfide isomerase [Quadrisphaera granulorum]
MSDTTSTTTTTTTSAASLPLTYVFDAYCGWCYGFGASVRELAQTADVDIEVISGGLFSGPRASSLSAHPYIPEANARISALTGAQFGPGYQRAVADGTLHMDSDDAGRGLVALKTVAPQRRQVELAGALQRAFYVDGLSLSSPQTYRVIAEREGLDADALVAAFEDPATDAAAAAERQRARALGVDSYPTLLARTDRGLVKIGSPVAGVEHLRQAVAALRG